MRSFNTARESTAAMKKFYVAGSECSQRAAAGVAICLSQGLYGKLGAEGSAL